MKKNNKLVAILFGIILTFCFIVPTFAANLKADDDLPIDTIINVGEVIKGVDGIELNITYCVHDEKGYRHDVYDYKKSSDYKVLNLKEVEALDGNYYTIPTKDSDGKIFAGWKVTSSRELYQGYDKSITLEPYYKSKYEIIKQPTSSDPSIDVTYEEDVLIYEWMKATKINNAKSTTNKSSITSMFNESESGTQSNAEWKYSKENSYWYKDSTGTSYLYGYFDSTDNYKGNLELKFGQKSYGFVTVAIYNASGERVLYKEKSIYSYNPESGEDPYDFTINLNTLSAGTYKFIIGYENYRYDEYDNDMVTVSFNNMDVYTLSDVENLNNETSKTLSDSSKDYGKLYHVNVIYKDDTVLSSNLFTLEKANQTEIKEADQINPLTGDNLYLYIIIVAISIVSIGISCKLKNKK